MAYVDDTRDVQNFRRNISSRSSVSAGSSLAMEIKRKKIRENTVFLQSEDTNIQEKIDFEIRMREGSYKLLVASSKREQILNASKSLLTCNSRIKAYLTQLHKKKDDLDLRMASHSRSDSVDDRVACTGKVAISGLRIPLMWKDSDHFDDKGSSRRVALFCLIRIGSEVFDTEMVVVDRSLTDVCFDAVTIFGEATPQFDLKVELYSCAMEDETALVNTPKKFAKKLRSSFGRSSGKKLCPLLEAGDPDAFLQSNPVPPGARYSLLAYTSLGIDEAEGGFQSHSLIVLQDAESSSWLPLYGNLCCCLVAQPLCMTQHMMTGYLSQQSVGGVYRCCSLYGALSAGALSCYYTPEEITARLEPCLHIPVNQETRIREMEKEPGSSTRSNSLIITNPSPGGAEAHVFSTDTREELEDWLEAFCQHLHDQSKWLQCCKQLMKIEVTSPRKPPLFLTRQADTVYNDLSINSPGKFESITDIIHSKIEETEGRFLIGHEEEREPPNWSTLFDGSRPMAVQKSVLSPSKGSPCPAANGNKKRRAPPPPPDKQPYTKEAPPSRPPKPPLPPPPLLHQEKENRGSEARPRTKTGRPSLDAKFSAIIQQLQRHPAPAWRNAPLGHVEPPAPHPLLGGYQAPGREDAPRPAPAPVPAPVPAPAPAPAPAPRGKMRKSLKEKMNPKAW